MTAKEMDNYHARVRIAAFCRYLAAYPIPTRDKEVVQRAWAHGKKSADAWVEAAKLQDPPWPEPE